MTVERFDHVGILVESVAEMLPLYRDLLGGEFLYGGDDLDHGVRAVQLVMPEGSKVELLEAVGEPARRVLAERGPGVHHLTFFVDDLHEKLAQLRSSGYSVTEVGGEGEGWLEAYIRPGSSGGVLIQLVQSNRDWNVPLEGVTLDAVLAGKVHWVADGGARVVR